MVHISHVSWLKAICVYIYYIILYIIYIYIILYVYYIYTHVYHGYCTSWYSQKWKSWMLDAGLSDAQVPFVLYAVGALEQSRQMNKGIHDQSWQDIWGRARLPPCQRLKWMIRWMVEKSQSPVENGGQSHYIFC